MGEKKSFRCLRGKRNCHENERLPHFQGPVFFVVFLMSDSSGKCFFLNDQNWKQKILAWTY